MLKQTLWAWNSMSAMFFQDTRTIPLAELKQKYQLDDSSFININGLNVHYRDSPCRQNPEAPVLLCLHGIFSSLHTWQKWIDQLNDRFHIITIDLPNFGLTGPFPSLKIDDNSYPDFLRDLLNALKIKKCHIAGNSLGGFFSYSFAAKYPERVEKMILLDSAGFFFVPPMALLSWGAPLGGWVAENSNPPKSLVFDLIRQAYANRELPDNEELTRYYEMMLRPGNRQGGSQVLHHIRNGFGFDTKCLQLINTPTLVMWGEKDNWIPIRHTKSFKKALANCQVITYADCGHMPMEEKAELSAADAAHFLLAE